MTKFSDLVFEPRDCLGDGIRAIHIFPNGYGASVIRGEYTYGGKQGLFELGVLRDGHLTYDTTVATDVVGYLTEDDVTDYLQRIENLPDMELDLEEFFICLLTENIKTLEKDDSRPHGLDMNSVIKTAKLLAEHARDFRDMP